MIGVPYTPPQPAFSFASTHVSTNFHTWMPPNSLLSTSSASGLKTNFLPNAQSILRQLFTKDVEFSQFAQAVIALRVKDPDEPEEDSPATAYAVTQTFYLAPQSRLALAHAWTKPLVVTDGYGGIRMSWKRNGRVVRVSVPGTETSKRRLYWEDGDRYGSEVDVTPTTLIKYLWWMNDATGRSAK